MSKQNKKSSRGARAKNKSSNVESASAMENVALHERASFFKRLLAMIYDTLVAVAVGMCAGLVMLAALMILFGNGVLSLQGFETPSDLIQSSWQYKLIIQIWVGAWVAGFFLWFWKKGGQTLGMRAWRLRIFSTVDKPMTWPRLILRLISSFGGLGTLLVLFDIKNKQSLQDRIAQTEVVKLSKEANDHKQW